uniref:Uncharacterized protein n=2 Tax=Cucumis melo TaxID=3656 RepID=A0A9I9DLD2_CUCME
MDALPRAFPLTRMDQQSVFSLKARSEEEEYTREPSSEAKDGSASLLPPFSQVQMWQKTFPTQFMVWIYLLLVIHVEKLAT